MENSIRKLIIAFFPATNGGLSFRGTECALYDYMNFSETILGHKSILCLKNGAYNEPLVLDKFTIRFDSIIKFDNTPDFEEKLLEAKVDALYVIRYGRKEEPMLATIPMLVHCVYDMSDHHGLVSAGVSKSIVDIFNKIEYVPHMVHLYETTEDFRDILRIPKNAKVFGRHGGVDTWDLVMAKEAVIKILNNVSDIYFIFAIRPTILQDVIHPRLICLEVFADLKKNLNLGCFL